MKTCLNCGFENPDDARYCARCRFTLDWSVTATDDPTQVLPPSAGPSLEVAMGPPEVRVPPGGSAVFQARVANRGDGPARARLQVAGNASPYATVQPAALDLAAGVTGAASVTVSVPAGTPPGRHPVMLHVVQGGAEETSVAAQATLVTGSEAARGGDGRRRLLVSVAGAAAVGVLVAAIATGGFGGGGDGGGSGGNGGDGEGNGISGTVKASRGLNIRPMPNAGTPLDVLEDGASVLIRCREGAWLKLDDRDGWVYGPNVDVERPPEC